MPEGKLPKILIADDDPEILKMVRAALQTVGAKIVSARNGEEALEKFLTEQPDLVILDVMMPKLSGWEVAKYIRARKQYDRVWLMMLSAIGELVNDATAPVVGADDHLDKPFTFEVLANRVRTLLAKERV